MYNKLRKLKRAKKKTYVNKYNIVNLGNHGPLT